MTILSVLKDYGDKSAGELVDIIHRSDGPWQKIYKPGQSKEIPDEIILSY